MSNINIGNAFPLEKLGSDIAHSNYNYQSILNGLIQWNTTNDDTVTIRLTKDSDPWFEDIVIPSKKSAFNSNTFTCKVNGVVEANAISSNCYLNSAFYGGGRVTNKTTFNVGLTSSNKSKRTSVNATDSATMIDVAQSTYFDIGDRVRLKISGNVTCASINGTYQLSERSVYYVIYKKGITLKLSNESNGDALIFDDSASDASVSLIKLDEYSEIDPNDTGDIVNIRATVNNGGGTEWELCYSPLIHEYTNTNEYKIGDIVKVNNILKRVISDCIGDEVTYDSCSRDLIITWNVGSDYFIGEYVLYNNNIYVVKYVVDKASANPELDTVSYNLYCKSWASANNYNAGQMVCNNGSIYMCKQPVINSYIEPYTDVNHVYWDNKIILPITSANNFAVTSVFRWYVNCDVSNIYLRNVGESNSQIETDIYLEINARIKEPSSIYQRSVGMFRSSNYSMWPLERSKIWDTGGTYGPTDTTIPINKRQKYSAVMIFDHSKLDLTKTVNFINYDGPDLDQGLCIYLPVEIDVADGGVAYPEDGFTFEFFFRIWPNASYNGSTTRDHIVNKSQIYVYSASTRTGAIRDICETPIAKFSMARTTNFYMFGENVSIPDKPVCYKAVFTYSDAEKRWLTLDYYQIPDHIFIGPVGFIDPQSPANMDINASTIGNINPNAKYIGYETAAFPLFQDPFSNSSLKPYTLSDDSDLDRFFNRTL